MKTQLPETIAWCASHLRALADQVETGEPFDAEIENHRRVKKEGTFITYELTGGHTFTITTKRPTLPDADGES